MTVVGSVIPAGSGQLLAESIKKLIKYIKRLSKLVEWWYFYMITNILISIFSHTIKVSTFGGKVPFEYLHLVHLRRTYNYMKLTISNCSLYAFSTACTFSTTVSFFLPINILNTFRITPYQLFRCMSYPKFRYPP